MAIQRQKSIEDQGGIENYLNDTKALHNGHDYTEFLKYQKLDIPKTTQGKLMNVSPDTVRDWIRRMPAGLSDSKETHGDSK